MPDAPAGGAGDVRIAPSILAAPIGSLARAARDAEAAGADALHVDVMDGHFVPEISFGLRLVAALRDETALPLDVHLMVANPADHAIRFVEGGAAAVTIHYEAVAGDRALEALLRDIRAAGAKAGVALKPATPDTVVEPFWEALDQVLVMTVEPGYSGQPFMPEMVPKVRRLAGRAASARPGANRPAIAVDGGIDERSIETCVRAGATLLVAGSSVYSHRRSVAEGIAALRRGAAQGAHVA